MSSSYGRNLRITIFGQSHAPAIGVTIEGLRAGLSIDTEALEQFMARRAPGRAAYATARRETDRPEFLCGVINGVTTGTPVTAIIRNNDARSGDYAALLHTPRPGHADYTGWVKYGDAGDFAGGGHFSGRMTAPLCIAGGICLQLLEREGILVWTHIASIGTVKDEGTWPASTEGKEFPTLSPVREAEMRKAIADARAAGDSLGGVIECAVVGVPAGLGDPMFDGMENRLATVLFGIPAVKGVEFGEGFRAAALHGSENNDAFAVENGRVVTRTNHSGGILGGITTGMPIQFAVAIKPTPSIAQTQETVDLRTMEPAEITVGGRHDPCIVPRAVPCVEAAAALAVYDAILDPV